MNRSITFLNIEWHKAVAWHDEQNGGGHLGFAFYLLCWSAVVGVLLSVPLVQAWGVWGGLLAALVAPPALAVILGFFLFLEKTEGRIRARGSIRNRSRRDL